jgi:hypothetical protein
MALRIRHVLDKNNLYAVYFLETAPWAQLVPCLHQALVDRTHFDDDENEISVNEILGLVVTTDGIVPADESPTGIFMWYVDGNAVNLTDYHMEMVKLSSAQFQAAQPPPTPPEAVTRVFEQRKGKQNGKSQRRPT